MESQENKNLDANQTDAVGAADEVIDIVNKRFPSENATFKKSDSSIPVIRTYKQDYSSLVKDKNLSKIEILSAELRRGYGAKDAKGNAEFGPKKKRSIILPVFILIAFGIVGYLSYLIINVGQDDQTAQQQLAQIPAPLIFSEKQDTVVLSNGLKDELAGEIRRRLQQPYSRNTFIYLPIVKSVDSKETYVGVKDFLSVARLSPPGGIVGSLEDSYTLGVYAKNERYPVLIFKVRFYENAFAGMLDWEKTMSADFSNIWPIKKQENTAKFVDKYIKNHDIRELDDSDGNLVLNYSFLDRNTLAISTNEEALSAIFERFTFKQ